MRKKIYNLKLVRDRIPEIIIENGGKCETQTLSKSEFEEKLYDKLNEEVVEFIGKPSAEEIADILEVIETLAKIHKISLDEIKTAKVKKKNERGGFGKRLFLKWSEEK